MLIYIPITSKLLVCRGGDYTLVWISTPHLHFNSFFMETLEIWKDIDWYEGLYMISNIWRIKSCSKYTPWSFWLRKVQRLYKERILKPGWGIGKYKRIWLYNKWNYITISIHRAVAQAFIKNPNNKPCVNHIDGNKFNNVQSNLEWVTYSENIQHAKKNNLLRPNNKAVLQFSIDWKFIRRWECARDIYRELWLLPSSISLCCNNKIERYKGFVWKFDSKLL